MKKKIVVLFLALLLLVLAACGSSPQVLDAVIQGISDENQDTEDADESDTEDVDESSGVIQDTGDTGDTEEPDGGTQQSSFTVLDPEGYYYDLESVVLYLFYYDELPSNFITKDEARNLGWEGGSVEDYLEGAAIGGDYFGNREGLLPEEKGRSYTECDIDTNGKSSRGAKRLVFSNDGLYFYTDDHYESFSEVIVTDEYEVVIP